MSDPESLGEKMAAEYIEAETEHMKNRESTMSDRFDEFDYQDEGPARGCLLAGAISVVLWALVWWLWL